MVMVFVLVLLPVVLSLAPLLSEERREPGRAALLEVVFILVVVIVLELDGKEGEGVGVSLAID